MYTCNNAIFYILCIYIYITYALFQSICNCIYFIPFCFAFTPGEVNEL